MALTTSPSNRRVIDNVLGILSQDNPSEIELKARKAAFGADLGWSRTTTWRKFNGSVTWTFPDVDRAAEVLAVPVAQIVEDAA